jgi:hypothetical protein
MAVHLTAMDGGNAGNRLERFLPCTARKVRTSRTFLNSFMMAHFASETIG